MSESLKSGKLREFEAAWRHCIVRSLSWQQKLARSNRGRAAASVGMPGCTLVAAVGRKLKVEWQSAADPAPEA